MDPIFTLSYPEFYVADSLSKMFKKGAGYSVYIPLSRQEKGIDLMLFHRSKDDEKKVVTIQVKSSRSYDKTDKTGKFSHDSCFNTFKVPDEADYIFLVIIYSSDGVRKTRKSSSVWSPLILVFSKNEMKKIIDSVETKSRKPDSKFYFGFKNEEKIEITRGNPRGDTTNYSKYLLKKSKKRLENSFLNE